MRRVSKRSAERLGCDFYGTENAVTAEGKPSFRSWIFRRGGYVPAGAGLFPALGAVGRSIRPFGGQSGQPPANLTEKRASRRALGIRFLRRGPGRGGPFSRPWRGGPFNPAFRRTVRPASRNPYEKTGSRQEFRRGGRGQNPLSAGQARFPCSHGFRHGDFEHREHVADHRFGGDAEREP